MNISKLGLTIIVVVVLVLVVINRLL
ncbi:uncharacterized protein METZ01_LOCUS398733 [marine metagenome]|uniref:Uncharacterized protein n=1 Tax=marine metagenome TaxID=408172 RepID=A0A382VHA8_9ZZZZ